MNMNSILITGGAGFFGQAFVRALLKTQPHPDQRLCIYSRNEWNQAQMRHLVQDDPRMRWLVGDVRDGDRLRRAMEGVDTVIHAAALKRVEVCDYNIMEAVSTNVTGTENVVKAAIDAGVDKAILLSTDKAVEPSTTYGRTKALAESLFVNAQHYAGPSRCAFVVTRYGNVAGSTGSVIPVWRRLIEGGETEVPMTDPQATRFWMTAQDAVALVLQAIDEGKTGDILVPELKAYDLWTLAQALGATGYRQLAMSNGEKMHERLAEGGPDSSHVQRMTLEELKEALTHV